MRPTLSHLGSINTLRTDALFVSPLQPSDEPGAGQVQQAVAAAVRRFGIRGCAGRVAHEFGEHPEMAAARMRWARQAVTETFGGPGSPQAPRRRPAEPPPGRVGRAA